MARFPETVVERRRNIVMAAHEITPQRGNILQKVRLSIFPDSLQPAKERKGYRRLFNSLVLHFRPRSVDERTLRFSLTWGLGGMAAVLVLLLLAEKREYRKAAEYMTEAARGLPQNPRIHYNLGLLLQYLQRDNDAERSLQNALALDPDNLDFLYALADFYLKCNRWDDAKKLAEQIIAKHPESDLGSKILEFIRKRSCKVFSSACF